MLTINNAVDNYLLAVRSEGKSPKTIRAYSDILHAFMAGIKEELVEELTENHIRIYMADLPSRAGKYGYFSTSSQMKHYATIRTFIRWLYAQGYITRCITDYTRPPKISSDLPDALSNEEVEKLKEVIAVRPFRDQVIIELFLDTGLRLREVTLLNVDDIYFDERILRVYGKGKKEALVPFGKRFAKDLHAYIVIHRKPENENEKALFINRFGTRLEYEGMAMLVRRILEEVGVKGKCGAHTLRHTFATQFLKNGGGVETLRAVLRHSDISITQRYVHLTMSDVSTLYAKASPLDMGSRVPRRR